MRAPSTVVSTIEWATSLSLTHVGVRAATGLTTLATIACIRGAGAGFGFVLLVVLVLAALVIVQPDTHVGAVLLVVFALVWIRGVEPSVNSWTLSVAGCLVVLHATIALASTAHPSAQIPVAVMVRWSQHCLAVIGLACCTWLAAQWLEGAATRSWDVLVVVGLMGVVGLISAVSYWGFPSAD